MLTTITLICLKEAIKDTLYRSRVPKRYEVSRAISAKFAQAEALDETNSAVTVGMEAHAKMANHGPGIISAGRSDRTSSAIRTATVRSRVAAFLLTKKPVPATSFAC